jgi:hypothetical protein
MHKNDYSCIVFLENGKPKKWNYVHNLQGFVSFLDKSHSSWKYLNVYDRRQSKYLKRFYKGNPIPQFLLLLAFALSTHFFLTFNNTRTLSSSITFNNDFNNTATIPTPSAEKGACLC